MWVLMVFLSTGQIDKTNFYNESQCEKAATEIRYNTGLITKCFHKTTLRGFLGEPLN
jgi:hypothetical protein